MLYNNTYIACQPAWGNSCPPASSAPILQTSVCITMAMMICSWLRKAGLRSRRKLVVSVLELASHVFVDYLVGNLVILVELMFLAFVVSY